ncbi:MAG: sigma-70 family RNA polymerase sigma factor [Acidobacteriota bacterium]|jgi:RNA polymerase sigma factor (TIGR02999 family)
MDTTREEVTELLVRWSEGDERALERLMPLVVDELRRLARGFFRGERRDHTLQPTELVNEVYLKLVDQKRVSWDNRSQFFSFASTLMRRVLVDHARSKGAAKRGAGLPKVALEEARVSVAGKDVDVLALDQCLSRLAELNARQARIVELRYFTGLTFTEIAEILGVHLSTVKRDWRTARLWLYRELRDGSPDGEPEDADAPETPEPSDAS